MSEHVSETANPPSNARANARAGTRLFAFAFGSALLVLLFVLILLRVSEALKKRASIANERTRSIAGATDKPPVLITQPRPTTWKPAVEITGTLKPWREADVGFETMGRLARVSVVTGESVKTGQLLGVLDGQRAVDILAIKDASVKAAQANLALAEDALRRTEALTASKSIPEAQAEQARQQVALVKAQLEAARSDANLARTGAGQNTLTAPFNGVVTRAPTAGGSVVQPGIPLFRVEDLSRLRLTATVNEDDANLIKIGQSVSLTVRDRIVPGKVSMVVPSLDPYTRRAPIEVEVTNSKAEPVLAYSFVRAIISWGAEVSALKIPLSARRPGSQDEVVRVQDGKARIVRTTLSPSDDGAWIVRSGLSASDMVMVSPSSEMREGDTIDTTEMR